MSGLRWPSLASVLNGVQSGAERDGRGIVDAVTSGVTLPRDVYRGQVDLGSEEGLGRALDLAGLAMTGGVGGAPAAAGETVLGGGPVRRLSYDTPLRSGRITKAAAEREIESRSKLVEALRSEGAAPERIAANQAHADTLSALLPKFDADLPRGRPFQPHRVIDAGDGRAVRVQEGEGARTYRVFERGEDGSLGRSRGYAGLSEQPDGRWRTDMLEVQPAHQGKGLASALYKAVEQDTGAPRVPSGQLLPDGYAFWKARDPEAVQFHRAVGDAYLSPRRMTEHLDAGAVSGARADEMRQALESVPAEGRTPEALARQHNLLPGAIGAGAAAGALAQPDSTQAAPMNAPPGLAEAIRATASGIGANPLDLATAMSYETGGTYDPWKAGPTTQWGQHRGLIQWGEPQRARYGVTQATPVADQVAAAGRYLQDAGFKPGMGMLDLYSAINAGRVGRYGASDANNGGAPGTVADKVNSQMAGHRANAERLLGALGGEPAGQAPQAGSSLAQALPGATLPTFQAGPDPSALAAALTPQQADPAPLVRQQRASDERARRRALLSVSAAFG